VTNHENSFKLELSHNTNLRWDQLVDNEEPIVWHEQNLHEYWAEFYDQMKQLDRFQLDILDYTSQLTPQKYLKLIGDQPIDKIDSPQCIQRRISH
jgi:hypothetical protein